MASAGGQSVLIHALTEESWPYFQQAASFSAPFGKITDIQKFRNILNLKIFIFPVSVRKFFRSKFLYF